MTWAFSPFLNEADRAEAESPATSRAEPRRCDSPDQAHWGTNGRFDSRGCLTPSRRPRRHHTRGSDNVNRRAVGCTRACGQHPPSPHVRHAKPCGTIAFAQPGHALPPVLGPAASARFLLQQTGPFSIIRLGVCRHSARNHSDEFVPLSDSAPAPFSANGKCTASVARAELSEACGTATPPAHGCVTSQSVSCRALMEERRWENGKSVLAHGCC